MHEAVLQIDDAYEDEPAAPNRTVEGRAAQREGPHGAYLSEQLDAAIEQARRLHEATEALTAAHEVASSRQL